MPYCTKQNLIDKFGEPELVQLTNPDSVSATTIDDTVLNNKIAAADARINRYITAYLPLANVPADFEQIACDITRYFLYKDMPTDHVKREYDNAIAYLEKVAAGKIQIAPDTSGVTDATTEAGVDYQTISTGFGDLSSF
jgi:phage gp36-like protein